MGCGFLINAHEDGSPMGIPGDKKLRALRNECHVLLDKYIKKKKNQYIYIQKNMDLTAEDAHIGKFNEEQCLTLIELLGRRFHAN